MRQALTLMAAAALLVAGGCSTGIKEGVGVVRGAKGVYAPVQPLAVTQDARPLGEYTRFEMETFRDAFGGKVPSQLIRNLPAEFDKRISAAGLSDAPGGKTLVVRGEIIHYEDEGLVGIVLGPLEEAIARVELVDQSTGRILGTANCIGRTTERVNKGVGKKTEGLAKAIVDWIKSRYPED